jgi:two-component system, NarL family, nitrate/nitrite response regulator NarL
MRIALCDDHLTFSESVADLLSSRGHEVVRRTSAPHGAVGAGVDVCVVDLHFPGVDGCDAVDIVRREAPEVPIVVLTARLDRDLLERALDHGASGAVLKTEGVAELESVLLRVAAASEHPEARPRIRSRQVQTLTKRRRGSGTRPRLTPREDEVLQGIADGLTTAQIAASLGVEVATVRTHVQHLLGKFGAHSRLELVAWAMRLGVGRFGARPDEIVMKSS